MNITLPTGLAKDGVVGATGSAGATGATGAAQDQYRDHRWWMHTDMTNIVFWASPCQGTVSAANHTPVANQIVCIPYISTQGGRLGGIIMEVTTAEAGKTMTVGVYACKTSTSVYPGSLLCSVQLRLSEVMVIAGRLEYTLAPNTLYWIGYVTDSSTAVLRGASTYASYAGVLGIDSGLSTSATRGGFFKNHTSYELPNPFPDSASIANSTDVPALLLCGLQFLRTA